MDLINTEQLLGLISFFAGNFILSLCGKWDKKRHEQLKDPKVRIAHYDKNESGSLEPTTVRGTLMTLAGVGLSILGAVLFFANMK